MPAWTAVVQYLLLGEKLSGRVYLTLVPIIGGAMMVCKGEVFLSTLLHRRLKLRPLVLLFCW